MFNTRLVYSKFLWMRITVYLQQTMLQYFSISYLEVRQLQQLLDLYSIFHSRLFYCKFLWMRLYSRTVCLTAQT